MNDSLKIITKGVNNRLAIVTDDIIYKTQTALMKNRFIKEGVVVLHEVMKKKTGVLFKVDFEKAYDNVNWALLYNVMVKKGFHTRLMT
jgi:hypothetical protein